MRLLVNHGGCRKCRAAGAQYGEDGFQQCLHYEVVTPQPERDSSPLASLPGRLDPHRYGAMLPLEHDVVGDMSSMHKVVHERDPRGCRECDVDGSQYAKKLCLRQLPNTKGTASSVDPYRHGATKLLMPSDYATVNYHMQIFLSRDENSEVMQPGEPYYEVYTRIITFNIYDNNLEDFNDLMDIVSQAEKKPEDEGERKKNPYQNRNPYPYPNTYPMTFPFRDTDTNPHPNMTPAKPGNEGSYVNEGLEGLQRLVGYRFDVYSPTICFQPRADI